jgi:hypothetical protein
MTETRRPTGLSRRTVLKGAAAGGLLVGTSGVVSAGNRGGDATYDVTIENLTADSPTAAPPATGQWFTPPVVATHRPATGMFTVDEPATFEVKEIAENGNLDPMVNALEEDRHVDEFVVAAAGSPPPLAPGNAVTIGISGDRGRKYLSFVSMLICTNDGFTGVDTLRLPKRVGDEVAVYTKAYDAGTEINTGDFADIVPPCQALNGVSSDDDGTGSSDPDLVEEGVVHPHGGVQGGEDLTEAAHGWTDPVGRITIERTG